MFSALKTVARLGMVAVMLLLAGGCASTLRVSQQEIQRQIDARLPLGTPAGSPVTLSLHTLMCDLRAADEANGNVGLEAQVRLGLLGFMQLDSRAVMQGQLVYDATRGAFFIEQPRLTALDLGQVPPQQQQHLQASLQQLLSSVLTTTPVYTVRDAKVRERVDRVEVQDNAMLIRLRP